MNNLIKVKYEISSWLKEEIELGNKKALLVNIEYNSIYSVLNYFLCKSTRIPVHAIINANDAIARQFCIKNHIPHSVFEPFITHIDQLMINVNFPGMNQIVYKEDYIKIIELEKTAFISYIAETTNSLYSGNLNRNEIAFIRNYPKVNGYDLLPFANFNETELMQFIEHMDINDIEIKNNAQKIHTDLEWAYETNERTKIYKNLGSIGIIEDELDPTKHPKWFSYTSSQKTLISKLYQEEKFTRFKKLNAKEFCLNEK